MLKLSTILFWGMCSIFLWGNERMYFEDGPCCGGADAVGLHRMFSPQGIQGKFNLESVLIRHNVSKNVFKRVMESGNHGQVARLKIVFIFCIQSQIKAIMFDDRFAA